MRTLATPLIPLGPDDRFHGRAWARHLWPGADSDVHAFVVSFEPGSRTAWHGHPGGQLLWCTHGLGYVGTREGRVVTLTPGTAVWTDPDEEHWHGAGPSTSMTHLAIQVEAPGIAVGWREHVTPVPPPTISTSRMKEPDR
jgi:quercetin dioxygenase-like cupin family protein